MNMTATCECAQGYVARVTKDAQGGSGMKCVEPSEPIPASFYKGRLEPRELPIGREVRIVTVKEKSRACSVQDVGRSLGNPWGILGLSALLFGTAAKRRRARKLAKG